MVNNLPFRFKSSVSARHRRKFLIYLASSATGTFAIRLMFPGLVQSRELDLENLCSSFPGNSRCQDYLPGARASDDKGTPISVDDLLAIVKPGDRLPVYGLPKTEPTYLVIGQGSKNQQTEIATYGIKPICTHLGCTVTWHPDRERFICPCHGSQYDAQGRVVQGPASRSLPLMTVVVKKNQIRLVDRQPAIDPR
jgi:cytochrome b6-f complex iron-sulfur subunit